MKYCTYIPNRILNDIFVIGIFGAACVCSWVDRIAYLQSDRYVYEWIVTFLLLAASSYLAGIAILTVFVTDRKYAVGSDGLKIQYPWGFCVQHSWEEFSEIGICKVRYTTRGTFHYDVVLRFVIGHEENGPSKGYGKWATDGYVIRHFRKIVTVDFTEARYQEIKMFCPLEIVDYRGIRRYFHDPE